MEKLPSPPDEAAPAPDIQPETGKVFSAVVKVVLCLILLFALGLGWMFMGSAIRNRGYKTDLAFMREGADADTVLAHVGHADNVSVDWITEAGKTIEAASFRNPKEGIKRPLDKAGKPAGIQRLEAEYQIFGFMRKFVTVSFDDKNAVSAVEKHTLD